MLTNSISGLRITCTFTPFDFDSYLAKCVENMAREIDAQAITLYMKEFGVVNVYAKEFYIKPLGPFAFDNRKSSA